MKSKPFLSCLLLILLLLSIIGRLQIGGYILTFGWWVLLCFPLLHLIMHSIYLSKVREVKSGHLKIIYFSHISYFLFFLYQYDMNNAGFYVIILECIRMMGADISGLLYEWLLEYHFIILSVLLLNLLFAEVLLGIKTWRYLKRGKVSS